MAKQIDFYHLPTGSTLTYTGKGFLGFDKAHTDMTFRGTDRNDISVDYKGQTMLVRTHEVTLKERAMPSVIDILKKDSDFTIWEFTSSFKEVDVPEMSYQVLKGFEEKEYVGFKSGTKRNAFLGRKLFTVGDVNHITIQLGSEKSHVGIVVYDKEDNEYWMQVSFECREWANTYISLMLQYMKA